MVLPPRGDGGDDRLARRLGPPRRGRADAALALAGQHHHQRQRAADRGAAHLRLPPQYFPARQPDLPHLRQGRSRRVCRRLRRGPARGRHQLGPHRSVPPPELVHGGRQRPGRHPGRRRRRERCRRPPAPQRHRRRVARPPHRCDLLRLRLARREASASSPPGSTPQGRPRPPSPPMPPARAGPSPPPCPPPRAATA